MINKEETQQKPPPKPKLKDIVLSTLSAALGVQSSKNRERDFTGGNFKSYVVSGIVFVVVFIGAVIAVVKTVLNQAGM